VRQFVDMARIRIGILLPDLVGSSSCIVSGLSTLDLNVIPVADESNRAELSSSKNPARRWPAGEPELQYPQDSRVLEYARATYMQEGKLPEPKAKGNKTISESWLTI